MSAGVIHTDHLALRDKDTDEKLVGMSVSLLKEGQTAPGGLIALQASATRGWVYVFNSQIDNGTYTVYVNGVVVPDLNIRVIRGGIITVGDTDFVS